MSNVEIAAELAEPPRRPTSAGSLAKLGLRSQVQAAILAQEQARLLPSR